MRMGKIGEDAEGDLILENLGKHANIDTKNVIREGISAFTLVHERHDLQGAHVLYLSGRKLQV